MNEEQRFQARRTSFSTVLREEKVNSCIDNKYRSQNDGGDVKGFFRSPFFKFPEVIRARGYRKSISFCLYEDKESEKNTDYDLDNKEYFQHKNEKKE